MLNAGRWNTEIFKMRRGTFLIGLEFNCVMNKELLLQAKQNFCKPSESASSAKSQSLPTNIILGQSPEDFLKLYNPVSANRLLAKGFSSGEIALLPRVPRLRDVATKYGQAIATKWIEIQLLNIDSLQGQTQFSAEAKLEASNLILSAYKDMTVAELLNFFARYKLGEFTEVTQYYGGIQKVLIALRHYRTMRDDDVIRIERDREYEQAEQERRARAYKCITYEEYLKTK